MPAHIRGIRCSLDCTRRGDAYGGGARQTARAADAPLKWTHVTKPARLMLPLPSRGNTGDDDG